MTPDDETNVIADISEHRRRFDARQTEQEKAVASLNRQFPDGVGVIAFAMLPWSIWNEGYPETANFLLRACGLYAVEAWNTIFLPANQRSALTLGLPEHPRGYPPGYEDACARVVLEVANEYRQNANPVLELGASASMGDISADGAVHNKAKRNVVGVAGAMASQIRSEKAYFRHRELFS